MISKTVIDLVLELGGAVAAIWILFGICGQYINRNMAISKIIQDLFFTKLTRTQLLNKKLKNNSKNLNSDIYNVNFTAND